MVFRLPQHIYLVCHYNLLTTYCNPTPPTSPPISVQPCALFFCGSDFPRNCTNQPLVLLGFKRQKVWKSIRRNIFMNNHIYTPWIQMTLFLIGRLALFWGEKTFKNGGHLGSRYTYWPVWPPSKLNLHLPLESWEGAIHSNRFVSKMLGKSWESIYSPCMFPTWWGLYSSDSIY